MRRVLLLPLILCACGGAKEAKMDGSAAPAALSAADVTGTYEGSTRSEASDSLLSTWTASLAASASGGIEGEIANHAAPKDTETFTSTISGDSTINV